MLKFSMANCLIHFGADYFQYGKEEDFLKRVLTIGGYDSAWLADLVACYILEMTEPIWKTEFAYFKIYRDDGCALARNTTVKKLQKWYNKFQQEVDWITDGTIKFTMEIWKPSDEKKRKVNDVITVLGGNSTPYLDADLFFNDKGEFRTRVYFKEGYKIKYVSAESVHPKSCKKAVIKSQCIRTAELTTKTPENENSSLSNLYPEVDKALREAGLLKGKTKLPKLGKVLDTREKDKKVAAEKKEKRKKDRRTIYIHERFANNWRGTPLHATANKLAKKHKLPFRFRMCHGRHPNLKETFIADCTKKVFTNVTYVPTCRTNKEFDPIKAVKFYKCACKGTKVDGKCIFEEQCKKEAIIYKVEWTPTSHTYIGKSQGNLSKRINTGHINGLVAFWNLRDKYNGNIAKGSAFITPKEGTSRRFSFSTVVTPECSQELTQTPTGLSPLINFMTTRLTNNPDSNSSDETDEETILSTSEESSDEEENSQTPNKTEFQKAFGRPSDKKKYPNPKSLEELRIAYNNVDSISELTRFLWKRVEEHEEVNGSFKNKGECYAWVRRNIKTSIIHDQSVTSRMKTAGKKFCSLCLAERVNIFIAMNSEGSNKLMNKKSEFTGACSCKARFLRLYLKGVGGADEASSGCRKLSCGETCATGLKTKAKRKPGRPKKVLNKVQTGLRKSLRVVCNSGKTLASGQRTPSNE